MDLTNAQDLIEALKETDLESYNAIKTETAKRTEEFKKRGGKRANSGRKKVYLKKVNKRFDIEKEIFDLLEGYAKEHNLSKNKAINLAIQKLITN